MLVASFLVILPVMLATPFSTPNALLARKASGGLLEPFAERVDESTIVVSDSAMVRAVAWYFKRSDVYVTSAGELTYGLRYPDSARRRLDESALRQMLARNAGKNALVLVCKRHCASWSLDLLPGRAEQHRYGRFVLWYLPSRLADSDAGVY